MKLKGTLIAAALLVAGTALADDNGFYAGAGVGWSQMSIPESKVTNSVAFAFDQADFPLETWSAKTDDSAIMWSAFVWLSLHEVRRGRGRLPGHRVRHRIRAVARHGVRHLRQRLRTREGEHSTGTATGWPVSVLGIWPVNDNWDVFGRVGGFFGDVSDRPARSAATPAPARRTRARAQRVPLRRGRGRQVHGELGRALRVAGHAEPGQQRHGRRRLERHSVLAVVQVLMLDSAAPRPASRRQAHPRWWARLLAARDLRVGRPCRRLAPTSAVSWPYSQSNCVIFATMKLTSCRSVCLPRISAA